MKNYFILAFANIKKRKSSAISLFLLVLLATLMLNIGLSISTRLNTFIQEKTVELKGAHFVANIPKDKSTEQKEEFITKYKYTEKTEKEDSIFLGGAVIPYGKGDLTTMLVILNADTPRTISPLILAEKLGKQTQDMIYLPYAFKLGGGYKLGDTCTISSAKEKYTYTIGGFFEETILGNTLSGREKAFISQKAFASLSEKVSDDMKCTFMTAKLSDISKADALNKEMEKKFLPSVFDPSITSDAISAEVNYTMSIKTLAAVLIAFAIIILLVSLIVVRFRVSNSIEDDMINIGALKSVGYTSNQILFSILIQFFVISIAGGVLGIAISYASLPAIGGIISASVGLLWTSQINIPINLISLSLVFLLVLGVTFISAIKVKRIAPIAALRNGIQTHSFKRNHFPLEKTNLNLQFLLGLKAIAFNIKQNTLIILIVIALCFASIFCSIIYYNFSVDKSSLFNLVGSEHCNVLIYTKDNVDTTGIFNRISKMDGVKKTSMLSQQPAILNNDTVIMYVSDDYGKVEFGNVYKGRQPKFDNEIAISGMIAKKMNKEIGDTVKVWYGDNSQNFLITGLSQQISNAGHVSAITLEGYKKIRPDFQNNELSVYLKGRNTKEFVEEVKAKYSEQLSTIGDLDAAAESQMGPIVNSLFSIMVLVIVMSLIVVSLILYFIIKTIMLKRKREFGIYKATGYTTFQLMTQISLSLIPVVGVGTLLGGIIGMLFSNKALSILFSSLGIYNAKFSVSLTYVILICIGMVATAYIMSMLVSRKVKKITAYSLITE